MGALIKRIKTYATSISFLVKVCSAFLSSYDLASFFFSSWKYFLIVFFFLFFFLRVDRQILESVQTCVPSWSRPAVLPRCCNLNLFIARNRVAKTNTWVSNNNNNKIKNWATCNTRWFPANFFLIVDWICRFEPSLLDLNSSLSYHSRNA